MLVLQGCLFDNDEGFHLAYLEVENSTGGKWSQSQQRCQLNFQEHWMELVIRQNDAKTYSTGTQHTVFCSSHQDMLA